MTPRIAELAALVLDLQGSYRSRTHDEQRFLRDGEYVGWINAECSTPRWTEIGELARKRFHESATSTVNA